MFVKDVIYFIMVKKEDLELDIMNREKQKKFRKVLNKSFLVYLFIII
jgi:hypothetical protein